MATTQKAIAFAARVRAAATTLEIAYRLATRVREEWYALNVGADIPFDTAPFEDGNQGRPLTNMAIYNVINRLDELCNDYDAGNKAKLNTVIVASDAPADWR